MASVPPAAMSSKTCSMPAVKPTSTSCSNCRSMTLLAAKAVKVGTSWLPCLRT